MDTIFDSVAGFLLNQSSQLLIVFAIVAVGTWLLRNQSAHWRYLLWLLVVGNVSRSREVGRIKPLGAATAGH